MTDDRAAVSSADVAILERDVDAWTRGRVREARERYRGEGVPDVDRARRFLRLKSSQIENIIDRAMAPTTCVDCKKITKGYARCYDCNRLKRARDSASAEGGGRPPAPRRDDDYKFKSAGGGVKTATAIAEHFSRALSNSKINAQKINRVLESLAGMDRTFAVRFWGVGEHESGSEKRRVEPHGDERCAVREV